MAAVENVAKHLWVRGSIQDTYWYRTKMWGSLSNLDLRKLHSYIWKFWFDMLTLASIIYLLRVMDWFATFSLKDAYFHMSIQHSHQKYWCFMVAGCHFQYKVLLFILTAAPRVFSKCLSVVAAHLRKQGIFAYPYLDDWLPKAAACKDLLLHITFTISLLLDLGLILNLKKNQISVQLREFLS